jgi:hypothetical protein
VQWLAVYEEGKQVVYFPENMDCMQLQEMMQQSHTTLIGYFKYNLCIAPAVRCLYANILNAHVWDQYRREWQQQ